MPLTKDRNSAFRTGERFEFPAAAATKFFAGGMAAINSSGLCVKASASTGLNIRGIIEEQADNLLGLASAINVKVRTGSNTITKANIGSKCYAEDDQTVGNSSTGKSVAGIVMDVDSDGVWVDVGREPYPSAHDSYLEEVVITTAELLALNATEQPLVAAPGADKALVLVDATFYKAAGTAYADVATGDDLAIKYTDDSGAVVATIEATGFVDQTTAQTRHIKAAAAAAIAPVANAPLVLHMLTGEITTGDSDLKVRVRYQIIDTSW